MTKIQVTILTNHGSKTKTLVLKDDKGQEIDVSGFKMGERISINSFTGIAKVAKNSSVALGV
jgi:hypothetical protein